MFDRIFLTPLHGRARARQAVRAAGGKIPLSFDYVISAQHSECPVDPAAALEGGADGTGSVAGGSTAGSTGTGSDGVHHQHHHSSGGSGTVFMSVDNNSA